ncbi:MAG: hypothetical protein ACOC8E_06175 [Planctomycetota bacterium]
MKKLCVLLLLCAGCLKTVTFDTVIHEDGSVDRHVRMVCTGGDAEHRVPLENDLRLPPEEGWQAYKKTERAFEAKGRFRSVADIPLDFEKTVEMEIGEQTVPFKDTSKSVKEHRTTDYGLFTVHDYAETITDVTSPEEFGKAVEKLVGLRQLVYDVADEVYGAEYDFSAAKAYVDKEIVPRARRLASAYWSARADKSPGLVQRLQRLLVESVRDLGAEVDIDTNADITDEQMEAAFGDDGPVERWILGKLAGLIKRKDGKALTPKQVEKWLDSVSENERVRPAAERWLVKRFGGKKEYQKQLQTMLFRLVGAYPQLLSHGFRFDAAVAMPGEIVASNGVVGAGKAAWSFAHHDVFPGYRMHVRSVVFSAANRTKDGKAIVPSARAAGRLAEFADRLKPAGRQRLVGAMRAAAKERSPKLLLDIAQGEDRIDGLPFVLKRIGLGQ